MIELLRALGSLFEDHAPETLMALFGAAMSMLLFYLVWIVLRQLFGLQLRAAKQDAKQDQSAAGLIESLVSALVTEAGHLRHAMDGILRELLRAGQESSETLAVLVDKTEQTPDEILRLLKPEFDNLHRDLRQAERRIITKVTETAHRANDGREMVDIAGREQPAGASEEASDVAYRTPE